MGWDITVQKFLGVRLTLKVLIVTVQDRALMHPSIYLYITSLASLRGVRTPGSPHAGNVSILASRQTIWGSYGASERSSGLVSMHPVRDPVLWVHLGGPFVG